MAGLIQGSHVCNVRLDRSNGNGNYFAVAEFVVTESGRAAVSLTAVAARSLSSVAVADKLALVALIVDTVR